MIFFTEEDIDRLIEEDIPYGDLTTFALGIENERGIIRFSPRGNTVVCSGSHRPGAASDARGTRTSDP